MQTSLARSLSAVEQRWSHAHRPTLGGSWCGQRVELRVLFLWGLLPRSRAAKRIGREGWEEPQISGTPWALQDSAVFTLKCSLIFSL